VAADEVQVWISVIQFLANGGNVSGVIVIVNGIRFLLANNAAIDEVPFPGQSDLNQLPLGEFNQVMIVRIPQSIVFEAEIFETVTNLLWIGHHLRRPRTKVLDPTTFDAWIVYVDPVFINDGAMFQVEHHGEK